MSLFILTYRVFFLNEIFLHGLSEQIYLITLLLVFSLVAYLFIKSRKEAPFELTVAEQHHFLRTISEFTNTADIIFDEKGKIRFVNGNFLEQFGNSNSESAYNGKLIEETGLNQGLAEAIQNADDKSSTILSIKGKLYDVTSSGITDYDGRFIGTYVRIYKKERESDKESIITEPDISHDLKTPLHAIRGYSDLLKNRSEFSKEEKELFKLIGENSEILQERIETLLNDEGGNKIDAEEHSISVTVENILVVDDVPINRKLLKMMLKQHKFTVREAENGEEAVRMAIEEKPDLVLMDISMPGMDGIEAVQIIRGMKGKYTELPIIAVTASMNYSKEMLIEKGFNGLLTKPFREDSLLKIIGQPAKA